MAFKRVIKNLKILTVPGEDTERSAHDNKTSEPEIETQLVELEDDEIDFAECMSTDSSGLKPQLIKFTDFSIISTTTITTIINQMTNV